MNYREVLDAAYAEARSTGGQGRVADYIPALASVDPDAFGLAVVALDGEECGVGDWREPFSIQSISKVFTLALALAAGGQGLWSRVGREPSGNPFNSLIQLEIEGGVPRNPFINAGALVVTDYLISVTGDARSALHDFLTSEVGFDSVSFDPEVAASEAQFGHRNAALAHFLASCGNLNNPVEAVLEQYYSLCSVKMSCAAIARAALFLAAHGVGNNGSQLMTRSDAKRINSIMLTCGTYDAAGEFAYRVGLPGKSGVGGGLLAVVPGRCTLCVWSPRLDKRGNSIAGVAALDAFTTLTGWSIF